MNQAIKKADTLLYNTDIKSIEQSLESIVFQNELLLKKMSAKIDEDILQTYYKEVNEMNDRINNMMKFFL